MENLTDLFERINESSLDLEVKRFLRDAIILVSSGKPLAHLEKLVDSAVSVEEQK